MSVVVTLVVILIVGFAAVGLAGILGWRARMRREVSAFKYVPKAAIDGLTSVDNALRRYGLRDDVTLIASGKIATGGSGQ